MKCLDSAISIIKNKNDNKLFISTTIINTLLIICAGILLYNLMLNKRETSLLKSNLQLKFAQVVVESENAINTSLAVGPSLFPECKKCFAVIRPGGHIVFDFINGEEPGVIKGIYKIMVFALDNSYASINLNLPAPGSYLVEISQDNKIWNKLGYGFGVTEFRLGAKNSLDIRYVKISSFKRPVFIDAVGLASKKSINF